MCSRGFAGSSSHTHSTLYPSSAVEKDTDHMDHIIDPLASGSSRPLGSLNRKLRAEERCWGTCQSAAFSPALALRAFLVATNPLLNCTLVMYVLPPLTSFRHNMITVAEHRWTWVLGFPLAGFLEPCPYLCDRSLF